MMNRKYNLGHLFSAVVNRYGSNNSLCFEKECLTFNEIDAYSSRIANYFFNIGLKNHDVIAISASKEFTTYAIVLACIKSGITYSFFDPSAPLYRLEKQFTRLNPKHIIEHKNQIRSHFNGTFNFLEVSQIISESDLQSSEIDFNTEYISDSTIAYVMFTSGSTGEPKGASISHRNIINFIDWIKKDIGVSEVDKITGLNKLFFDNSIFDFYATFFTGASLYPVKDEILNDSVRLFNYLDQHRMSIWFSVPSLIIYHLTVSPDKCEAFKNFKKIIFGGEGFPKNNLKKLWKIANTKLINVYGPTECTCICSSYEISDNDFKHENMDKLAPIGDICHNTDYIIIANGVECQNEEVGELYIGGVSVGYGYWNNNDLTSEKFVQNPRHSNYIDIYYKSGDLVYLNNHDTLEFVSRADYQIKHMGYRIELPEIENVLQTSKKIYEACAVYKKQEMSGQGLIKLFYSGSLSEKQVLDYLTEKLPQYMIPRSIIRLKSLPKNNNDKIDRKALSET